jgi:tetratricopeptide (TPR) repeat protein
VDEREKYREKGLNYWAKAKELSDEAALTEFVYPVFGGQPFFGLEGADEAFANYEKALEYGKKMKDKFIIGCALDWLTYHTAWKGAATDDPDERIRLIGRAVQYCEEAKRQFSIISFVSPRGDMAWTGGIDVEHPFWLSDLETDLKKKRDLFEKASQALPSVKKRCEESGYPEIMMYLHNGRAIIRLGRVKFETDLEEKKRLLEEALFYSNESIKFTEQLEPFLYWNRGVSRIMLSNIKSELSSLTKEPKTKKTLLQEAVTNKENAIELLIKELTFVERKGSGTSLFATVGSNQYEYGNLLIRLHELTSNKELLRKAIKTYEDAAESYQKLNLITRIAENDWKKAQVYDTLGEHLAASQNFDIAASNYRFASEKIPQLKDFYVDHAFYMQAWSEIEKARNHHEKQEYGLAEEHFEKAAKLHEPLKQWNYMAPNYAAWAQLDHAEELSRKENGEEAIQAFERATALFEETRKSLQNELVKIEDSEEKQMATTMLKTTGLRHLYCTARIAVEEAKILDKKGDHYSSSEKYDSAAETFGKITQAVESERDRKEFDLITTLSQAWAKMTRAEAEESPSLYTEASQLFEKAKELSPNEKAKTLALGHSRFCRALEAGMQFADTGDATLHSTAIQHLESAGKYYVKAGFQNASEYAKATELLLDAYLHIDNAKKETDPEKKAKLFTMAEKVLQTSAGCFMKAEHPEKREQVLRFFEKVKEERELALSLSEILHTPSIVSTTKAFTTPTPNQENAVGLERFENADIQANIIIRQRELKVGENLDLEIELVNAGKGPALLTKITEIIPDGFDLAEKPEIYRVEDSYLNMKGKRLDPLKTEEVRIVLKPRTQGTFQLKPKILYIDENGKYKAHEPEPITITVKELGIKGWLKGER